MDGPVHRIAIDRTGTKVTIAHGKEVIIFDQNTICETFANSFGIRRQLTLTASFLDQRLEVT